jgi:hypothetical protein
VKLKLNALREFERDGEYYTSELTLAVEHDLRDNLTDLVERSGTQTALARDLGISGVYLCDILHGRRGISEKLAGKMGWRKVTVYVRP